MTVLTNARVVTPHGVIEGAWVRVAAGTITDVGTSQAPVGTAIDLGGRTLVPGFVDVHVHGGGGHDMTSGDPGEVAAAVAFHQAHGTTSTLLSLVTAPVDHLVAAGQALAALVDDAQIVGLHYEGPFLASCRCGAQDPQYLLDPDPAVLQRLLDAGRGTVRMVTLAPELPGGLDLVRNLVGAGVIAAIGHSDATFEQATAAIAAGARVATHLFNGMRPFTHRDPGIPGAALSSPAVVCELIVDGAHLHAATVALASAAKGADGVALITDAIAAAGAPDGAYRLGQLDVEVIDGVARLAGDGPFEQRSLAGSTLTMDRALRTMVAAGVPLSAASHAASLTPARVLGIHHRTGSIEPGKSADLVALDHELSVDAVIARGVVVRAGAGLELGPLKDG